MNRRRAAGEGGLWILCGYLVATVVAGALLAPGLFAAGKWLAATGEVAAWDGWLGVLADEARRADLARYFNRGVLIAAVVLLVPALRLVRLRWDELPPARPGARDLGTAGLMFLLSGGVLLAMGAVLLVGGVFKPRDSMDWGPLLASAALSAIAVSLIEEWLFRGAITALALRSMKLGPATAFVAVLFAVLHFMQPPDGLQVPAAAVGPWTGLHFAGVILGGFLDPGRFGGAFLTLLAVAAILGWARARSGSLWPGIGLHAGWVFALKVYSGATRRVAEGGGAWPSWLIGADLRTGLLPLVFLAATALILWGVWQRHPEARK